MNSDMCLCNISPLKTHTIIHYSRMLPYAPFHQSYLSGATTVVFFQSQNLEPHINGILSVLDLRNGNSIYILLKGFIQHNILKIHVMFLCQ